MQYSFDYGSIGAAFVSSGASSVTEMWHSNESGFHKCSSKQENYIQNLLVVGPLNTILDPESWQRFNLPQHRIHRIMKQTEEFYLGHDLRTIISSHHQHCTCILKVSLLTLAWQFFPTAMVHVLISVIASYHHFQSSTLKCMLTPVVSILNYTFTTTGKSRSPTQSA